mgnify:CR=1 FL=1
MGGMTSALGLGIILTLQDKVSAGLASIQQKLINFKGVSDNVVKNFDEGARQMIGGFMSMLAGKKAFDMIDGMFGTSVAVSRSFEMAMARVQAVSGATGDTFNALRDQSLEMGRTTRFTAMDAAGAQENLIRTGRNAADTMAMLPSVLKLASAEGLTLTEASDMVSSSLRMFNMDASEATRVANGFAEASRSTAANSRLLYQALSYSGGTMGQTLGYNIEQTMAMLGVLHNAVQRGSRAGTGLEQVMNNLVNPKKLKALDALGIQTKSEQGEILPGEIILAQLNKLRKTMGKRDFLAALSPILPTRAKNAGQALINALDEADNEYEKLLAKLNAQNDAAGGMQQIMDNTSQGAMYRLQSATEALRIALGDQLRGAYDWVIGKTADFKSWITQLIRKFPTLTKLTAGFVAGLLALVGTLLIVTGAMAIFAGSIKIWAAAKIAMGVFFAGLKASVLSSISMLWSFSTPILAAIALVYGLKKAWDANLWGIRNVFDAISVGFGLAANADEKGLAKMDAETHDRLEKAGNLDSALNMAATFYRFKQFGEGFKEGFLSVFEEIGKLADKVKNFFGGMTEGSQALLNILKIFMPIGESSTDNWKEAGQVIGKIVVFFLGLALAVKAAAVAITLFNWACNPLFVILATLTAIIAKWETIELLWKDPAKLNITNPGELNYEQYKAKLINAGAVIDKNDKLVTLPKNIASMANVLQRQAAIVEAEGNLKHLHEQSNLMRENWNIQSNQISQSGWSREMENVYKDLGITTDTTELTSFNDQLKKNFQGWNKAQNIYLGNLDAIKDSSLFTEDWGKIFTQPAPNVQEQTQVKTPQAPVQSQVQTVQQAPEQPVNAQQGGQSAGIIITHEQNQSAMNGAANAQAAAENPVNVNVKNDFDVKVTSSSSDVYMDGEKVGSITHKHEESHQLRQGIDYGSGMSYGGAE